MDDLIDTIVASCRECRAWARPKPEVQQSVSLATRFNQTVETDLMFYKDWIVHHFIDRASRWLETGEIADKLAQTLIESTSVLWIGRHGPPECLVCDGESGYGTEEALRYFKSHGVTFKKRAPGQHARYIERRGALLRLQMHITEEQAKRESIEVRFKTLLSRATFTTNATLFRWRSHAIPGSLRTAASMATRAAAGGPAHWGRCRWT